MTKNDLLKRSQDLVLRIVKMSVSIPDNFTKELIADNLLRTAAKVCIDLSSDYIIEETKEAEEERLMLASDAADMTLFWLKFLGETELVRSEKLVNLKTDYQELKDLIDSIRNGRTKKSRSTFKKTKSTHNS